MSGPDAGWEVLVIGAGPAGTAAALHLQKNGIPTCLCDKAAFPRPKSCGGLLEEHAFRAVEHTAPGALLARFAEVDVCMPAGACRQVPVATVLLDRTRFDGDRLRFCRNMGVTIREGAAAVAVWQEKDQLVTSFRDGRRIRSRAVIAADGSGSLIRKGLGLPPCAMAVTMQTDMPAGPGRLRGAPLIRFFADNPGYGWIFPGRTTLNVGVYSLHNRGVHALFQNFLKTNDLPPCAGKGSFVLLRSGSAPAGSGRILLAGDAAGLANPLTGGGMQAALYSGRAAAEALLQAGVDQPLPHYEALVDRLTDRSFHRLSFARHFYQSAHQHQTYQECLAAVKEKEAARPPGA
jgi:geranylgeranyl reductase family protein